MKLLKVDNSTVEMDESKDVIVQLNLTRYFFFCPAEGMTDEELTAKIQSFVDNDLEGEGLHVAGSAYTVQGFKPGALPAMAEALGVPDLTDQSPSRLVH